MKNITIRQALASDASSLYEAECETSRTPGLLVSRPYEFNRDDFERKINALKDHGLYLVAQFNGQAVGHAYLEPLGLEALAHVMSLTIVVHPGYVEQGIGHALMTRLLEWAGSQSTLLKVELRVREVNHRAIRLYQRFGFVEEGRLQNRIRLPDGALIADLTMAWFAPDKG